MDSDSGQELRDEDGFVDVEVPDFFERTEQLVDADLDVVAKSYHRYAVYCRTAALSRRSFGAIVNAHGVYPPDIECSFTSSIPA